MNDYVIERVNLYGDDRKAVEEFLNGFGLTLDFDVEYTLIAKDNSGIAGTCSFAGKVLKCFAVRNDLQGEGVAARLITSLTDELFDRGIHETFIFTKPANRGIFEGLGYRPVYSTCDVTLLEGGMANVSRYVEKMFDESWLGSGKKAGLVMNCNPFTLGHRYLIESASRENDEVVVFIVEENRSLFPFDVRLELVRRGTRDLKNVHVIPGGNYIISSNTFPSYFLRQEDVRLNAYTRLDAGIFGKYIAPAFNIVKRYIGTEPYCNVTENYNEALLSTLPQFNIEVRLVERLPINGRAVSASEVRELIKKDDWYGIEKIVPTSTFSFLISDDARDIIEKIKRSDSPH